MFIPGLYIQIISTAYVGMAGNSVPRSKDRLHPVFTLGTSDMVNGIFVI